MNDQNDDAQGYALMAVAGVVALVVAGVIALAVSTTIGTAGKAPAAADALAPVAMPAGEASGGVAEVEGRVYFELGSDALPASASAMLVEVADAARAQGDKVVLISGYHDASGDPVRNAELAKNRALAVRHALEANGVPPERLVMDKPVVLTGGPDDREARRVEVHLR